MSDLTGEIIDSRYQLSRLIASGGMATIYSALDLRLDRIVAVKIMHPHLANDEEFVTRFIREAKAAAALSHPNIVAIQDQGWNEGGVPAVFIVMELIEGFTLRDVIYEQGAITIPETLRYFAPILSAMATAHKAGILHRDIKPENILISKDGRVKIADFGLAKGADFGATMTAESSVLLGSVSYLSPEQVQRGISDSRSDIYALGVVLFEMLTGKKPYDGESPLQIALKHVNETIPAPSTLNSKVPPELDLMVLKATSINPDKRFRDAGSMLEDFQAIRQKLDPTKRQLSLELDIPLSKLPTIKNKSKSAKASKILSGVKTEKSADVREKSIPNSPSKTKKRKTSGRVKRNRVIAFVILLALLFGGYSFLGGGEKIAIPSVAGMTETQARRALTEIGLRVDATESVFSEDVEKGLIIESNPAGGGKIGIAGTVRILISRGPERITVPAVAGLSVEAATTLLQTTGLKVGQISRAFSSSRNIDQVISSSPAYQSAARKGALIDLVVSKGIEQVALTSYVGKSGEQALNDLTDAGLAVTTQYAASESVPLGIVISQDPDTNAPLARGSKVVLVVSSGPAIIFIPNVYSLTELKATTILENLGFQVKTRKIGSSKIKTVTNVSPSVGSKAKPGSVVTITLG